MVETTLPRPNTAVEKTTAAALNWKGAFDNTQKDYKLTSDIKPIEVPEEDVKWTTEQINKYTFDDTDPLKEFVTTIQNKTNGDDELATAFEDITELFETNAASHMNFCRMGGVTTLLEISVTHKSPATRSAACRVFTALTSNNPKT